MTRLFESIRARLVKWWHARMPTREAIVVTAFLAVLFEVTYLAAFFVRGELLLHSSDSKLILSTILWVVGIKLVIFYWRGFCHRPWRAARFEDLNRLLRTSVTVLLVLVTCNYFVFQRLPGFSIVPRSVLLLDWVFTLLAVGGMQALARSAYEELVPITTAGAERPVLVIDASEAGRELALALPEIGSERYFVAGLLDDDPERYGVHVGRARVLGPVSAAAACATRLRAGEVIVRQGAIYGRELRELCDACADINVRVRIAEDGSGTLAMSAHSPARRLTVRPIKVRDIDIHDLLARPHARLDDDDPLVHQLIGDRCMMVTGAGGSVGGEICRQAIRFHPEKLVLFERSEAALFEIHRELVSRAECAHIEIVPIVGDIGNAERVAAALAAHKPAVIVHAAAFKHLPLMESHPIEAIENNTLATATLADLAAEHGVETFIALSTDKAVYPSSIMGASKLVAERYLEALSNVSKTKFVAVRFGNVLGSSGSVVPIFMELLRQGQRLMVTHPSVRRFFLTLDEAAQMVLLAGAVGHRGGIHVLEMGEPLSIVDLAGSVAFVMHVPQEHVEIEYCGLRPGEKLDEDLFFADEKREPTVSPLIFRAARPARSPAEIRRWLDALREAIAKGPKEAARKLMQLAANDSADTGPAAQQETMAAS
jgi:FlaA1/EpsC-like NDP-sugar epimerase